MIKLMILTALLGVVAAESYRPRGWRPDGPRFEPSKFERLENYAGPAKSYGPPANAPSNPQQQRPPPAATTERAATTTEPPATTTRRSREPTTATPDINDEDVESSPALAIANSFAFNRPVYVYNTYPYYPGLTFVQ